MGAGLGTTVEERLRNWADPQRGWYDRCDARKVECAWHRLEPRHKALLQMSYVWRADREVICRRLKIRRRPMHLLDLELTAAKVALKKILEQCG